MLANFHNKGVAFADFIRGVESEEWKDKIFMGISQEQQGFLLRDCLDSPGLICVGGQGAGKSFTMSACLSIFRMVNGRKLLQILIDTSDKGMGDYAHLFKYRSSIPVLRDVAKVIPVIDLVSAEMARRGLCYKHLGVSHWRGFNKALPAARERLKRVAQKGLPSEEKEAQLREQAAASRQKLEAMASTLDEKDSSRFLELADSYRPEKKKIEKLNLSKQQLDALNRHLSTTEELRDLEFVQNQAADDFLCLGEADNEAVKRWSQGRSLSAEDRAVVEKKRVFSGLAHIQVAFEEFHDFIGSSAVNWDENKDRQGTVANQLFRIARTGRGMGVTLFLATQKASYREIPPDLRVGINNFLAHRISDPGQAQAIDLPQAADISPSMNGRSVTKGDSGRPDQVQFPFFEGNSLEVLCDHYHREFDGTLCGPGLEGYHQAIAGDGNEGIIKNYPLGKVIQNASMFTREEKIALLGRLLGNFGFRIEIIDNEALEIGAVAVKGEERYALLILEGRSRRSFGAPEMGKKKMQMFENEMSIVDAQKAMVVNFGSDSGTGSSLVSKKGGFSLEYEDLVKSGQVITGLEKDPGDEKMKALWEQLALVSGEQGGSSGKKGPSGSLPADSFGGGMDWDDI